MTPYKVLALLCVVFGLALLAGGLLIPAHLRAVDAGVLFSAGRTGDSLLERGKSLADARRLGAAQLYAPAGRAALIAGWDRFGESVTNSIHAAPAAQFWGNDLRTENIFHSAPADSFTSFIVQAENREAALAQLKGSTSSAVQELLRCRALNNTTMFPPSTSSSGQAFDAAVAECGLLLDGDHLTTKFSDAILALALQANRGTGSQPVEQVLMDFVSLGERLNWDQLTAFVAEIPDAAMLHQLADAARNAGDKLPVLFAAVQLSGEPAAVAKYCAKFPKTGLQDIAAGLCYGVNGVKELAQRGQRFYQSEWLKPVVARDPFGGIYYHAAARSLQNPGLVMAVKWFCYLAAGFFLAAALHFLRPRVSRLEQPLQVRGFHLFREFLFSLGFLLVVLLLSEPFLAQEGQVGNASLRLHLPMAGGAIPAGIAGIKQTLMNPTILLTLLVFFVLQALIYISCLVKLAEIRRQQVPPRMKLKLLENEDHLFDAGLYLGFVGTIVSLIIASMGLVKFSLMAAYSSTSFGIIFVVIFKIFHLRPARRKLLLEAEAESAPAETYYQAAPTPVTPS
ncbi:MAG: hypothetical protein JF609_02070 [Verrucomicrobia bacterium]|nr:hypothetical protein [Verrucomicrobiota bacterium]